MAQKGLENNVKLSKKFDRQKSGKLREQKWTGDT